MAKTNLRPTIQPNGPSAVEEFADGISVGVNFAHCPKDYGDRSFALVSGGDSPGREGRRLG